MRRIQATIDDESMLENPKDAQSASRMFPSRPQSTVRSGDWEYSLSSPEEAEHVIQQDYSMQARSLERLTRKAQTKKNPSDFSGKATTLHAEPG